MLQQELFLITSACSGELRTAITSIFSQDETLTYTLGQGIGMCDLVLKSTRNFQKAELFKSGVLHLIGSCTFFRHMCEEKQT